MQKNESDICTIVINCDVTSIAEAEIVATCDVTIEIQLTPYYYRFILNTEVHANVTEHKDSEKNTSTGRGKYKCIYFMGFINMNSFNNRKSSFSFKRTCSCVSR